MAEASSSALTRAAPEEIAMLPGDVAARALVGLIAHTDFDRAVLALGHDHGHGQSARGIRRFAEARADGGEQIGLAQGTLPCLEALGGDQLPGCQGRRRSTKSGCT